MRDNVREWPSTTQRCSAVRALAVLVCSLTVAGCASLSESECRGGDWYAIGVEDGAGGANTTRLATHRDACAKYAIEPDAEQYEAGRKDGLMHYCTVERGFETGRSGNSYSGACPAGRDVEFLRGYELGRRYYTIDGELEHIDDDLRTYQGQLSVENDDQQRQRLVSVMRQLQIDRWRLESERRDLDWQFERL